MVRNCYSMGKPLSKSTTDCLSLNEASVNNYTFAASVEPLTTNTSFSWVFSVDRAAAAAASAYAGRGGFVAAAQCGVCGSRPQSHNCQEDGTARVAGHRAKAVPGPVAPHVKHLPPRSHVPPGAR